MLQEKGLRKVAAAADLQYSSACQAFRQTPRDCFPSEENCCQRVTECLNKTQEENLWLWQKAMKGIFRNNYDERLI